MRTPPSILIVEDNPANLDILESRLKAQHYDVLTATDGEAGLAMAREKQPDLILLDIMMPKMNGLEVCRRLKKDSTIPFIPIIMVTAKADSRDVVAGLDAGADEYLTKPVDPTALVARVKSMLRIKDLNDTIQEQAAQLVEWNQLLERRVQDQLLEIERFGRLRRFLSPQLAQLVVSSEDQNLLESHRREITVVFCDLRGFTAFSEMGEPEEIMEVLREYHHEMGRLIFHYEGTLERFTGDGLMVFFNDPLPCPDPAVRAVRMAVKMRDCMIELNDKWKNLGHQLGFGVGIAQGYVTLGRIGFEGRFDYAAIGTVTNTASRLCDNAESNQILITQRVYSAVKTIVEADPIGEIKLKGMHRSMVAYNVVRIKRPEHVPEK
ncbi:Adenylate cyclase (EC [Olavius algarvensis associated proteobacterium Delta 3]|nr:Adenylate cyclase (EC [Olavius algarvensis associated proteobacterium Delta 3]CAB5134051.1 Adenylate cyclase (EC [Olavius algarvensis associated proteobacterium Delta 3]